MKFGTVITTIWVFAAQFTPPVHAQTLVLTNARIYTVDSQRSWADTVAIDAAGVIVGVGQQSQVLAPLQDEVEIVDLKGRMVLPGFQDVHVHAVEAGLNANLCLFDAFGSLRQYKSEVRRCAEKTPLGEWIVGAGINMFNLLELDPNPVAVLDKIAPDRPVLILDDLGHGAWLNSVALAQAGYDVAPDLANGNIILRGHDGKPNGVVLENAPNRARNLAYPPTPANLDRAYNSLLEATEILNANGITTVSDAGGYWPQGHHLAWSQAEEAGTLTVRASNTFYIYPDLPIKDQITALKNLYRDDPTDLVRFKTAKIYVDGILSQATGALLAPYATGLELPPSEALGFQYFQERDLKQVARELAAAGFQLNFHVTGDLGTRLALNAIAQADAAAGPHRLTHVYLARPADITRFAELGVVADLQLSPSAVDTDYVDYLTGFIGPRAQSLMPVGELLDSGALVTLSNDWDADELNPLIKIKTAVERRINGVPDVATAIELMTINPARALGHQDKTGSIEVGKFADLVVLGKDILDMPVARIDRVKVEATLLQGDVVYDRAGIFDTE